MLNRHNASHGSLRAVIYHGSQQIRIQHGYQLSVCIQPLCPSGPPSTFSALLPSFLPMVAWKWEPTTTTGERGQGRCGMGSEENLFVDFYGRVGSVGCDKHAAGSQVLEDARIGLTDQQGMYSPFVEYQYPFSMQPKTGLSCSAGRRLRYLAYAMCPAEGGNPFSRHQ